MFEEFLNPTKQKSVTLPGLKKTLESVAKQLCNIKDIRDELNILKTVATWQNKVQSTMAKKKIGEEDSKATKTELLAEYILTDIEELGEIAMQVQEAVGHSLHAPRN